MTDRPPSPSRRTPVFFTTRWTLVRRAREALREEIRDVVGGPVDVIRERGMCP